MSNKDESLQHAANLRRDLAEIMGPNHCVAVVCFSFTPAPGGLLGNGFNLCVSGLPEGFTRVTDEMTKLLGQIWAQHAGVKPADIGGGIYVTKDPNEMPH